MQTKNKKVHSTSRHRKKNCCSPLLVSGRGCYSSRLCRGIIRRCKSSNSTSELCNFCAKIYFRKFQKEIGFHWLRINKRATYKIWLLSVSVPAVFLFDINKNSNVTNDKNVLKSNEPTYQISLLKRYGREIINRVIQREKKCLDKWGEMGCFVKKTRRKQSVILQGKQTASVVLTKIK